MIRNERGGKVAAQDRAVRETESDIVAFSDANATWSDDALRKLVRAFADEDVAYVCGQLKILAADDCEIVITPMEDGDETLPGFPRNLAAHFARLRVNLDFLRDTDLRCQISRTVETGISVRELLVSQKGCRDYFACADSQERTFFRASSKMRS